MWWCLRGALTTEGQPLNGAHNIKLAFYSGSQRLFGTGKVLWSSRETPYMRALTFLYHQPGGGLCKSEQVPLNPVGVAGERGIVPCFAIGSCQQGGKTMYIQWFTQCPKDGGRLVQAYNFYVRDIILFLVLTPFNQDWYIVYLLLQIYGPRLYR